MAELTDDERKALFETCVYGSKCALALRAKFPNIDDAGIAMLAAREVLRTIDEGMAGAAESAPPPADESEAADA